MAAAAAAAAAAATAATVVAAVTDALARRRSTWRPAGGRWRTHIFDLPMRLLRLRLRPWPCLLLLLLWWKLRLLLLLLFLLLLLLLPPCSCCYSRSCCCRSRRRGGSRCFHCHCYRRCCCRRRRRRCCCRRSCRCCCTISAVLKPFGSQHQAKHPFHAYLASLPEEAPLAAEWPVALVAAVAGTNLGAAIEEQRAEAAAGGAAPWARLVFWCSATHKALHN